MGYSTGSMESCSSGEEVVVKARKPYTITKQRERWTEEEHGRFLEALKLYGRAWQRIEEHIGTKTAIQIRSHAQKFFTKLEKEALTKGIPPGQTIDIEIPPPRPKRKPSNPYPRKTCIVASSSTKEDKQDKLLAASHSSSPNVEVMKLSRTETSEKVAEGQGNEASTEILALFTDGPLTSASSKESTRNPVVFREFVPSSQKDKKVKIPVNEVSTAGEENKRSEQCANDVSAVNICKLDELHTSSQAKTVTLEMKKKHGEPKKIEIPLINDPEHSENYQKHAPMHPVHEIEKDGEAAPSHPRNTMSAACQQSAQINNDAFRNPSCSTMLEQHTDSSVPGLHQIPGFPPFCLPYGQDAYRSFFNASSNFSNLVVSTLVQNPAAHAAATITASFWPGRESDRSKNTTSERLNGTIPAGNMSPHPNMASIAAATVAAATAWWAMHGLLPVCHPPFSTSFPFVSAAATSNPIVATNHIEEKHERRVDTAQILPDQDKSILDYSSPEHLMFRRSASKSAASSDSDESKGLKRSDGTNKDSSGIDKLSSTPEDNCQGRSRKRKPDFCRDRSKHSCSETTVVEKIHPCQESLEDSLADHASIVDNRTPGCGYSVNEPRKGVSEEGRLAFQALFAREELPQSFSPSSQEDGVSGQGADAGAATPSVDLNNNAHAYSRKHDHVSGSGDIHMRNTGSFDKLSSCETENSKPRARRMGFKPYKRCSVEANVGRVNSEEEKGGKRLHVEAKTSNL